MIESYEKNESQTAYENLQSRSGRDSLDHGAQMIPTWIRILQSKDIEQGT